MVLGLRAGVEPHRAGYVQFVVTRSAVDSRDPLVMTDWAAKKVTRVLVRPSMSKDKLV